MILMEAYSFALLDPTEVSPPRLGGAHLGFNLPPGSPVFADALPDTDLSIIDY